MQDPCLKVACVSHTEGSALYSMVDLAVRVKRERDLKKGGGRKRVRRREKGERERRGGRKGRGN